MSSFPDANPRSMQTTGMNWARRVRVWSARLLRYVHYRESSETATLILSALAIGLMAGLGAVVFDRVIHASGLWFGWLQGHVGGAWSQVVLVLTPALGGLLLTPIVLRWSPDARGSGIPHVMYAVSNLGGRLPKRLLVWRPIASALSIGTGSPLGSEGPVVQLTATLASLASQVLRLDEERRRNLIAVAAAGGIAASFNAPIAGMLFALEIILGKFGSRYVASVVIGAVAASVLPTFILGSHPAFVVPPYDLKSVWELPLYFVLGVGSGVVAALLIKQMVAIENGITRLRIPHWARPALGGLVIGLVALVLPQALGRGYDVTGAIVTGELTGLGLMLAITVGKIFVMNVALATWHAGGIFAPVLMIGAAFGALVGQGAALLWPDLGLNPAAFAVVGMAAMFAGAERAPMTTIMLIMEMSNQYSLILPLLLASVVAMLVGQLLQRENIYHVMLERKGLRLLRLRESDLLQTIHVGEVMDTDIPRLYADDRLEAFREKLLATHHHGFVVTTREAPDRLLGILTLSDVEEAGREELPPDTLVCDLAHYRVHTTTPEEPISTVLERMALHGIGRMPVVDPKDRKRLVGFVRQSDLARAYHRALERERSREEDQEATRLRELTGQDVVEVRIPRGSRLAGLMLREARLPQESIVVAIRRRGQTIFPHGDTMLQEGDTVVANVAPGYERAFREAFTPPSGA